MCGIAGLYVRGFQSAEALRIIEQMNGCQVHRGPDDEGTFVGAAEAPWIVALGNRRLAIQDLGSAGRQPMRDVSTGTALTLNGEIYNFKELRTELQASGHRFFSGSDTEVVMRGCLEWGVERAVGRFRGMFAFALWDGRNASLYLVRDRLGVKPLYVLATPSGWFFASEVRTLLATRQQPPRLSPSALARYLALGAVQEPGTLIEGIRSLPAGAIAVIGSSGAAVHQYWDLAAAFHRRAATESANVELVREKLDEAVRLRLVSDAPTGVFLSGGIDSTAVTALAARHSDRLRTVSIVFAEAEFSEERFIRAVTTRFQTDHVQVALSETELLALLPRAIGAMDQPTFDGVNTFVVAGVARGSGLKVALSGIGGDELFGGYPSFDRVRWLLRLRSIAPAPVAALARQVSRNRMLHDRSLKLTRWLSRDEIEGGAYGLIRELFGPADRRALAPGVAQYRAVSLPDVGRLDSFNAVSEFELSHYMRNVLLRDTDFMGMAHGLEIREPLLDHELVELLAALPGDFKRTPGRTKALLVSALADLIPLPVQHRTKMGFTLPFARWMHQSLRSEVDEVLRDQHVGGQVAEYLDPGAVEAQWSRFLAGRAHWTRPWALYVLKLWGQQYLPR